MRTVHKVAGRPKTQMNYGKQLVNTNGIVRASFPSWRGEACFAVLAIAERSATVEAFFLSYFCCKSTSRWME